MKIKIVLFLVLLSMLSCRHGDKELTFIGLSDNGESKSISISREDYEEKLSPIIGQIYSEAVSALDQSASGNSKWYIERAEVGIAVTGTLGIGVWKVGATPGFRLMFRPKKQEILNEKNNFISIIIGHSNDFCRSTTRILD